MPGDRGTLTRGAQPAQDNGRQPTAPGSRRPPHVARERKPALAALALLLIAGGALGAAYLVLQNGHRVAAIEITRQLGAGERVVVAQPGEGVVEARRVGMRLRVDHSGDGVFGLHLRQRSRARRPGVHSKRRGWIKR